MTLTIDFTPIEQERVAVAARQKGLAPAEFIKRLVTENLPPVADGTSAMKQATDVEENIRAMDAFAETNHGLPTLRDKAFDRENLYDERTSVQQERDPELVARVKAVRDKYAHTAKTSGSEELHRERQRDKEKEEAQIKGFQP